MFFFSLGNASRISRCVSEEVKKLQERERLNDLFRRAELPNDRPESYLKALEQNCVRQPYNLVLCVLSNNRKDRYDALKKFLCMDTAIPSQVNKTEKISID